MFCAMSLRAIVQPAIEPYSKQNKDIRIKTPKCCAPVTYVNFIDTQNRKHAYAVYIHTCTVV